MASLVLRVCRSMERIAPLHLAEKWDNVGLLLEAPILRQKAAERVILTNDLTPSALEEAVAADAGVIISYHPPIFRPLKSLTLANPLQASLLKSAAHGISIYCPHTALDCTWNGVNDWLIHSVLQEGGTNASTTPPKITVLGGEKFNAEGVSEGGLGRIVRFSSPVSLGDIVDRVKKYLALKTVQVGYASSTSVSSVAVCAGSGSSVLLGTEADVYLTGEMAHHDVLAAISDGKHVILCGHTNTERGYLKSLATRLKDELGEGVEILISKEDAHPLQFV